MAEALVNGQVLAKLLPVSVSVEVIPASRMAHPGRRPVEYVDYIDTVDIPGINTITMYRLVKRVVAATLKFQKNASRSFSKNLVDSVPSVWFIVS